MPTTPTPTTNSVQTSETTSEADATGGDGTDPPAIRVEGLRKSFGDGDDAVTALDGVSFAVDPGSVVGLLGPNGAGKTTAVKSMLGLVLPEAGTVEIAGVDVHAHPGRAYARVGAILEGTRNVYWRLTVRENLAFFAGLGGEDPAAVRDRHDRLLDLLDLAGKADVPVKDLSRGMKRKVAIASTLARDVDVVFLDEPTLGLDVEASIELRSELRRLADHEDVTIVLTSHDMDVVEAVCDRVLVLRDGRVITDDDVDALLDLFRVTGYRVTVPRPLPDPLRREVRDAFDAEFVVDGDRVHVDVTLADADELYDLLGSIRDPGRSLLDVQSTDPGLESVFLRIVDGDGSAVPSDGDRP